MNIDLFAGGGGWTQARECELLGVELDRRAATTHRAAHGNTSVVETDVRFVSPARIRRSEWVEGLVASPPTQTFSRTGRNSGHQVIPQLVEGLKHLNAGHAMRSVVRSLSLEGEDERTTAALEPMRWIAELDSGGQRLAWVVIEHVRDTRPILEAYEGHLRDRGFSTWLGPLDAVNFGVAQARERLFLIATREGVAQAPRPMPVRLSMGDLLDWLPADAHLIPGSWVGQSQRARKPTPLALPCPPIAFGKDFSWKWESESDPACNRLLTTEELSLLMGFPADYPWAGDRTHQWHQIASATPPPMAQAVLRAVLEA